MRITKQLGRLVRRLHRDERGALTIETVLIIAAIAMPILLFIVLKVWPKISEYFNKGLNDLETGTQEVNR